MKKFIFAVVAGLFVTSILSVSGFIKTSQNIRNDVLRLHVLANSDTVEDQDLKLKVRDAVLEEGKDIFGGEINVENAEEKIATEKSRLVDAAENVVKQNGFDYDVDVFVTDEYFGTRSYGDITLPAGNYTAVKVTIGESAGHNWWCVMFPPMCLPAAEDKTDIDMYLSEDEVKVVKCNPEYDVRFKIVEWYEQIKHLWTKE